MTIEEKAKAYDEVLERVKPLYELAKKDDSPMWSTYEYLFPQLAESEDDRIRKELIEYHKQQFEKNRDQEVGLFHKDALAYLEKQKEQKPIELGLKIPDWAYEKWDDEYMINTAIDKYSLHAVVAKHHGDTYDYNFSKSMENWLRNVVKPLILEKQKEQKPAEKHDFVAQLKEYLANTPKEQLEAEWEELKKWNNVGPAAEEYLRTIEPAEWNEEDEGELQNAIDALEFLGKKGVYKSESGYDAALQAVSWLKSLHPQPKQEWSEEDEILRVRTINRLETLNFHGISGKEIRESIDWLKSLRPQPHWKPTKKQIDCLKFACEKRQEIHNASVGGDTIFLGLASLYNSLKNLM